MKISFHLLGIFAVFVVPTLTPVHATPVPVGHWLFSEGSGDVIHDETGNATPATLAPIGGGSFTGGVGGKFGGALYFDAPTTKDWTGQTTFAQFTSDFDLSAAGSISFFVNHDRIGVRQAYFNGDNTKAFRAETHHTTNRVFSEVGGPDNFAGATGTVSVGTWQHVVVTWDTTANQNRVYLDGVLQGTAATTGPITLNQAIRLGRRLSEDPNINRPFYGGMDDVAFYDHALTPAEIATIGTGGASTLTTGQVVHWNLDNSAGTVTAPSNGGSSSLNLHVGTPRGTGVTFVSGGGPTLTSGNTLDALEFDGADELSRVIIKGNASLSSAASQGTVVLWAKLDHITGRHTLVKTTDESLEIQVSPTGGLFVAANDDNNTTGNNASGNWTTPFVFTAGQWTHIAYSWDQATSSQTIYINGDQAIYANLVQDWDVPNFADWVLGNDPIDPRRHLDGSLADFAVFAQALTDEEVKFIYDNGVGVPEPATFVLAGLAMLGLAVFSRRRK